MLPSFMRSTLILAALLVGGKAAAAVSWLSTPTSLVLTQAGGGAAADDDDDEPVKPPEKKPDAPSATPTPTAPPDAPAATTTGATATASAEQMKLVNGAPLFNPNVGVHIVEQKRFSDSGRFEVTLYPVALQVNGKFTQHFGTMGQLTYHLQENFGLMITGGGNWFNAESSLNGELVEKARVEAQAASSLLWTWGVMGGVEVTPFYGKFTFFDGTLAQFSFVLNGGAGIGGTRHQLKPESVRQNDNSISPATYGDTGTRFMAGLGAGFRLQLGQRFAFRLEVRDVVYTARVEQVNGCNVDDLRGMDAATRAGRAPTTAMVGPSCRVETFEGTDENGLNNRNNIPLALGLVRSPSSDVLNNVGLYAGLSFLF
jgi:outer membrane beta-barrel protein